MLPARYGESVRVLVVENDDRVARALVRTLRAEGFTVDRANGIRSAIAILGDRDTTLALVDLGLDDGDGVDLIRTLRDRPEIGVIAVTARGSESDRVRGLRAGADDYLVKPFGAAELLARIEAVTRRVRIAQSVPASLGVLAHGSVQVDLDRYTILADGDPISTTRKEFEVFALLVRRVGQVVGRDVILDQVWQSTWESGSRTLDTHMTSLRSKLGDRVKITTVRGVGYRLEAPHTGNE